MSNPSSLRPASRLLVALVFLGATSATTQELTGRDIALRMDQVDQSADNQRRATMVIERGAKKLTRSMTMYAKKYGVDERSIIRFIEPADVRDTQFLSWTYDALEQEDDLWVFFPTENLVRRISGGGKKGSFMRSDFSNEDIERRAVDDDEHTLVGEEVLGDRKFWVLESRPVVLKAADSNYGMRKAWVDAERFLPIKIELYDKRDRLSKVLSFGGFEEIDGIWTATKLIMETPKRNSRTLMQYSEVRYNVGLEDGIFEQTALTR